MYSSMRVWHSYVFNARDCARFYALIFFDIRIYLFKIYVNREQEAQLRVSFIFLFFCVFE
jgi:hypothetical protein